MQSEKKASSIGLKNGTREDNSQRVAANVAFTGSSAAIARPLEPSENLKIPGKPATIKTRVMVKLDVGFPNALFIRGQGATLSWDRGILLKNISADEWLWESTLQFPSCEFKILINDIEYEEGENHVLKGGTSLLYTPRFASR